MDLGLTQEEAVEKASLHPTYWGSCERGERNVSLENIVAMAKALGCLPKDLMQDC
jgi:transcriptional regulator with XRE-family HTH domain